MLPLPSTHAAADIPAQPPYHPQGHGRWSAVADLCCSRLLRQLAPCLATVAPHKGLRESAPPVQIYINDMQQIFLGQTTSGSSTLGAPPTAAGTPQNSGAGSTPVAPATGRKLLSLA